MPCTPLQTATTLALRVTTAMPRKPRVRSAAAALTTALVVAVLIAALASRENASAQLILVRPSPAQRGRSRRRPVAYGEYVCDAASQFCRRHAIA